MTYAKPEVGKKQPKVTSAENKRIVREYSYFSSLPLSSNFLFFFCCFSFLSIFLPREKSLMGMLESFKNTLATWKNNAKQNSRQDYTAVVKINKRYDVNTRHCDTLGRCN